MLPVVLSVTEESSVISGMLVFTSGSGMLVSKVGSITEGLVFVGAGEVVVGVVVVGVVSIG